MAEEKKDLIKMTVDGREVEVKPGTRVIEAARMAEDDVPYYCYHPGLSIAGNCRMCLVEVEGIPKLQIACHMEARDGMVVHTQSERVKKTREHTLEFLLINHPVDCPVCDQAGECWLQDYYMKHGLYDSRLNEDKIKKPKAVQIGPNVMLDAERCILCSRCVRFCDEVPKTSELGILSRGDHSEVSVFPGEELNNPYSGNVVDICPVGALTDKDFRFKIRVWYLKSEDSICNGCSKGCNIQVHYNLDRPHHGEGRVKRLKPRFNEEVNQYWICDEGRYGYKYHDQSRILGPSTSDGNMRNVSEWDAIYDQVADKINESSGKIAVLLSPQLSNEEIYLAKKLFQDDLKLKDILLVSPKEDGFSDDILIQADKNPNTRGANEIGYEYDEAKLNKFFSEAAKGAYQGVVIFGQDLLSLYGAKASEAMSHIGWSLFIGSNDNETSRKSNYVFASSTHFEQSGTFTNCDGKVQVFNQALQPVGEGKAIWEILKGLGKRFNFDYSYFSSEEIFKDLAFNLKFFKGLEYDGLRGTQTNIRSQSAPTIPALQQYDNIL